MTLAAAGRDRIRIAWRWWTMGPYHFARMAAVARQPGVELTVIESTRHDDHGWTRVDRADAFRFVTLTERPFSPAAFRPTAGAYARLLEQFRPDVIVEPGYFESCSRAVVQKYRAKHPGTLALFWSESSAVDKARRRWREWLKGRIVQSFDGALVAGTPHAAYLRRLGMPANRIRAIGGCVDNEFFRVESERARADARRTPAAGSQPYFLYVGRFIEAKNLLALLDAYRRYRAAASHAPWRLVLVGQGPQEAELRRTVADGVIDGVEFAGLKQVWELPAIYAAAGCFVLPSTSEPWGLVVNEAMASGVPVLVSNRCGCASELVEDGVNGFTFDPADVDALATLMRTVSGGGVDLDTMGRRGMDRVSKFTTACYADAAIGHVSALRRERVRT